MLFLSLFLTVSVSWDQERFILEGEERWGGVLEGGRPASVHPLHGKCTIGHTVHT